MANIISCAYLPQVHLQWRIWSVPIFSSLKNIAFKTLLVFISTSFPYPQLFSSSASHFIWSRLPVSQPLILPPPQHLPQCYQRHLPMSRCADMSFSCSDKCNGSWQALHPPPGCLLHVLFTCFIPVPPIPPFVSFVFHQQWTKCRPRKPPRSFTSVASTVMNGLYPGCYFPSIPVRSLSWVKGPAYGPISVLFYDFKNT